MMITNNSVIALNQDGIIARCKFTDENFISPTYRLDTLVIENLYDTHLNECNSDSTHPNTNFDALKTFRTVLELIHGFLVGSPTYQSSLEMALPGMAQLHPLLKLTQQLLVLLTVLYRKMERFLMKNSTSPMIWYIALSFWNS